MLLDPADRARPRRRAKVAPGGRPLRVWATLSILALGAAVPAAAQSTGAGQSGPRRLLPRAEEIALAGSAAPSAVSKEATVWVLTDTGYVVARRGTNGVACYVSRGWIESIEPHCFDAEGAATIMPMEAPAGFFIIAARTDEEALAIARSCPHLRYGGTVALRPIEPT